MMLRIREILNEKGMTNADFQKLLGVSKQYASNIINGQQNASITKLQEIADALGVHISELFAKAEEPENNLSPLVGMENDFVAMIRFRGQYYHAETLDELGKVMQDMKGKITES